MQDRYCNDVAKDRYNPEAIDDDLAIEYWILQESYG